MRQKVIWLVFIVLFLLEGTIAQWVIPITWQTKVVVIPHLVFTFMLFNALYSDKNNAILYGLIFGFLQDWIFYGHLLGIHSLTMGFIAYSIGLMKRSRVEYSIFYVLFLLLLANFMYEEMVFGIYRLFQIVSYGMTWSLIHIMLPSIVFNLIFSILIYIPTRKLLEERTSPAEMKED